MTAKYDLVPNQSDEDAKYAGFPRSIKLTGVDERNPARVTIHLPNGDTTVEFRAGIKGQGGELTVFHDLKPSVEDVKIGDLIRSRGLPVLHTTVVAHEFANAGQRRTARIRYKDLNTDRKVTYKLKGS